MLRGHLALSLGGEAAVAEAIRAIEVRVIAEEGVGVLWRYLLRPHLLLPPGACS